MENIGINSEFGNDNYHMIRKNKNSLVATGRLIRVFYTLDNAKTIASNNIDLSFSIRVRKNRIYHDSCSRIKLTAIQGVAEGFKISSNQKIRLHRLH